MTGDFGWNWPKSGISSGVQRSINYRYVNIEIEPTVEGALRNRG